MSMFAIVCAVELPAGWFIRFLVVEMPPKKNKGQKRDSNQQSMLDFFHTDQPSASRSQASSSASQAPSSASQASSSTSQASSSESAAATKAIPAIAEKRRRCEGNVITLPETVGRGTILAKHRATFPWIEQNDETDSVCCRICKEAGIKSDWAIGKEKPVTSGWKKYYFARHAR